LKTQTEVLALYKETTRDSKADQLKADEFFNEKWLPTIETNAELLERMQRFALKMAHDYPGQKVFADTNTDTLRVLLRHVKGTTVCQRF